MLGLALDQKDPTWHKAPTTQQRCRPRRIFLSRPGEAFAGVAVNRVAVPLHVNPRVSVVRAAGPGSQETVAQNEAALGA